MLHLKLVRDLWRVKTQVITIALVVASGIGGFIASLSTYQSLISMQAAYYEDARFAHVFVQLKRAPLAVQERLLERASHESRDPDGRPLDPRCRFKRGHRQ
jgi:putative ABC transport system permease protein